MSLLKEIFIKPVDRPIEGVIKADDEASLRLEIEEYVLTNEVEQRLGDFLSAYNNYEGANGVWVSGFFGSGKSHLLKMLALLLENRQIDGTYTFELFKDKCEHNALLLADLQKAIAIPSKSILFNIDQKADVISKTQIDALLAVFVKVFDEMSGYYGKQGYIAQFERDLDSRQLYDKFKATYEANTGTPWHQGREQAVLEGENIDLAYAQVSGSSESSAQQILDKYRSQYKVSIEDFANNINNYILSQGKDFRLNFFVDEVGQYIADNVKLMTNLQTIAESLATKCHGRAWIIVTAQEEMQSVVGEMSAQQGNDFSKIQARFKNRLKLTSKDVAEVIQKRLLRKTQEGELALNKIYEQEVNNFRTLFDFTDGSQTYANFRDLEHFKNSYPFIPYQFTLFQAAIQNLSQHNAFEGRHSSVGERSMLGVFREVAIQISDHKLGQLATFDLMFEGIRTALKSNIQRAILVAEGNLSSTFAIRLLKTLFLVKYVKEFKPSIRNLSVLMLESFDQDASTLRGKIEEALTLLEQQTYIQRNGDLYEFLTDEEKDIEQEIKNTDVEDIDIVKELDDIIFEKVLDRKIRYSHNNQDYSYTRKLDNVRHGGREHELCIDVISPFHDYIDNPQMLRSNSAYHPEVLFVVMPSDERLIADLIMYKRTEKYIRQNQSSTQQGVTHRILVEKGIQNQGRQAEIRLRIEALLAKSLLLVNGVEIESTSTEPKNRISTGFNELITQTYPHLRMLRGIEYKEENIASYLNLNQQGLHGSDATVIVESEQEILSFIQSNKSTGVRTNLKGLIERFERKPYGWSFPAVLCNLALLCARGKVELRIDGNLLPDNELESALRNTRAHANLLLDPQVAFTGSQVRALKDFYQEFFNKPPHANETKALGEETSTAFDELRAELQPLVAQATQYHFLNELTPVIDQLKTLARKDYSWYFTDLNKEEDTLLDLKDNLIDPIRKFMNGPQKGIFDNAKNFIENQRTNFNYVDNTEFTKIEAVLQNPSCFKGNTIQQLKQLLDAQVLIMEAQIKSEQESAKALILQRREAILSNDEFALLNESQASTITDTFTKFINSLEAEKLIVVIRENTRKFRENTYIDLLNKMTAWAQAANPDTSVENPPSAPQAIQEGVASKPPSAPAQPTTTYISLKSVNVPYTKPWLADKDDVEDYINAMRTKLMEEISNGKRIEI